jgi:voltage-dependent calcium channel
LPVILNLLGLWLVVFIFFAILKVEVFSMTKWGSGENRNQNYSSMSKALVMLSFMSVGYDQTFASKFS